MKYVLKVCTFSELKWSIILRMHERSLWEYNIFQLKEGKISLGITVPSRMAEEMKKEIKHNFSPCPGFELRTSHYAVLSMRKHFGAFLDS